MAPSELERPHAWLEGASPFRSGRPSGGSRHRRRRTGPSFRRGAGVVLTSAAAFMLHDASALIRSGQMTTGALAIPQMDATTADPRQTSAAPVAARRGRGTGAADRWRGLIISLLRSILPGNTGFRHVCEVPRPVKPTQPWSRTRHRHRRA